jgi:uncharacterized protein DUF927
VTSPSPSSSERSFDRILAHLDRVRRSGPNQATALCPAHDNTRTPALSITYLPEDRRTLLNCHSVSCSAADILSAVGLEAWAAHDDPPQPCEVCGKLSIPDAGGRYVHDFCAGRSTTRPAPRPKAPRLPKLPERIAKEAVGESKAVGRRREVARWEHIDLAGEVVAFSVRSEQRRKDVDGAEFVEKSILPSYSDGKGGWGNKQPGQFVPIWRLPEVLAAIAHGEPIWWCEGHKAAQAVVEAGGEASTVLLGELHRDEAEALRGATVRIIPDHDVVGYEKALKAAAALDGIAERVEFLLPATTAAGDDAWDHFAAGFGLDDFVPVDAQRVEVLKILATAGGGKASNHKLPHSLQECRREVEAWLMRAGDDEAEAQTNAQLWAGAAGQHLRSLLQLRGQLLAMPAAQQSDLARMAAVVDDAAVEVGELYAMTQASIDDDLKAVLRSDDDEVVGVDAEVFALPVRAETGPRYAIDMPGEWRYDDGADGAWERGVYWCTRSAPWRKIAKLPYVLARIVRRDGRGRRIATDYLIGGTAEDAGQVVNRDELDDGRWAGRLGWALSHDTKVKQATATAIEALSMAAPEREQVPRINPETGRLDLPAEPGEQYFELAPIGRDEALEVWRSIIAEAGDAPKIAHLLGASAIAPYLSSISDSLPHWISVTGAAGRGKTIGLKVGAAIWGNSVSKTASGTLIGPWSASAQAVPQMLGELGIMPAFLDDAGSAGYTKQQWAQLIYRTCAGASRKRTNVRDGRVQIDKSWWSILFTNANDHLTSGIDSGAYQGVIRRVIEIPGPATISAEQAKRLVVESVTRAGLVNRCYGHLGMQIVESVDARQASLYLDEAAKMLPDPEGDAGEVARILQLHLAGAIMIDDILGTGQTLTLSALESVADTLDEWLPGESEGDRLIAMIRDSLMSDPAAWPTTDEYHDAFLADLLGQHSASDRHKLLQTGLSGLRTPDGGVAVLPRVWQQFARSAEINVDQAHRELEAAGILVRNRSAKNRTQTWQTRVRFGRGVAAAATWCSKVMLPELDDDNTPQPPPRPRPMPDVDTEPAHPGAESPAEGAVLGDEPDVFQPVLGDVLGGNPAPTRGVLGVLGVPDKGTHDVQARTHVGAGAAANEESPTDQEGVMAEPTKWLDRAGQEGWARPMDSAGVCLVCGKPCVLAFDGQPIHPPCWKQTTSQERARMSLESGEAWLSLAKPWPACAVCDEPTSQALNGVPLHVGECVERFRTGTPQQAAPAAAEPATSAARPRAHAARFVADSAVLSTEGAWLSNGERVPLPEIRHVGDLVEWAQHMRLGFGGTAHHLPEPGRIWLGADMCAQLQLPTQLEAAEDAAEQLRAMRAGDFFAAAEGAGWQVAGAEDRPWMKVHQGNKSAIITGVGWGRIDDARGRYDEILAGTPSAEDLAKRLGLLCRTVGFPYTVTPAQTGVASIEYALRDGLPPVPVPDVPYNHIAANPSWIDLDTINAADSDAFVHVFDRRKSFLAGAGNALVGDGAFVHHPDGCDWDPNMAGFYRVEQLRTQPLPFLAGFDFLNPATLPGGASGWVSAAAMAFLQQQGDEVGILEAVTWPVSGRRLKTWQATIRKASETLEQLRSQGDAAATSLLSGRAFKAIYTDGFGALARSAGRPEHEPARRYRPHWRAEVVGTHTTNTLRAVQRIWSDSGVAPIAIGLTDAIAYIGPSTDPAEAWPGQGSDSLTNPALGKFKPAGYMRLGAWLEAMAENANARRPVSQIRLVLERGTQW